MRTIHTITFVDTDGNDDMRKVFGEELSVQLRVLADKGVTVAQVSTQTYEREQLAGIAKLLEPVGGWGKGTHGDKLINNTEDDEHPHAYGDYSDVQ